MNVKNNYVNCGDNTKRRGMWVRELARERVRVSNSSTKLGDVQQWKRLWDLL